MTQWPKTAAAAAVLLVFLCALAGCGGNSGSGNPASPTKKEEPFLATWSIRCAATTLTSIGQQTQCTATATLSDNSTQDQTSLAKWTSSNSSVATVSASGLVAAVANGTTAITGSYQTSQGTVSIRVDVPLTMTHYSGSVSTTPYSYIGYHVTGTISVTLNRGIDSPVPSRVRAEWENSMVGGTTTYHAGQTDLQFSVDQDTVARPNFSNSPTDYLRLIDVDRQVVLARAVFVWK